MRKALVGTLVLALAMVALPAAADDPAEITAPTAGQIVYENTLQLSGRDVDAADNNARWAVRFDTCAASTGTVAGNVDGFNDQFSWTDGEFSAALDISDWDAGRYCFVLNTQQGAAEGSRLTQWFYVVDGYVKIGGNVDNAGYLLGSHAGLDLKPLRGGGQLSHSFSGIVGDAGPAGIVGSISVNYRQLDEVLVFSATALTFRDAPGIGATDPMAVAEITANGATILVLDRDASASYPRGAVIVRPGGSPGTGPHEIDGSPGSTGADSWVPLVNGNSHAGSR